MIERGWINCKDELPNRSSHEKYFVTDGEEIAWCYFGCDDDGFEHDNFIGGDCYSSMSEKITHWMPMPKIPQKEKE